MVTGLKDYAYDFPKEKIGEKTRRKAKTTLNDKGFFKIAYPREVQQMFSMADKDAYAYGTTLYEAQRMFERKVEDYRNAVQTEKREKVILVKFLYNSPGSSPQESVRKLGRCDHGHWSDDAGRFALALDYRILYRIGNALYDVPIDEGSGRVYGAPHFEKRLPIEDRAYNVIDWTEEREEFLSNIVVGMDGMIARLRHFFGKNLLENMTLAIANGGGMTALPAPEKLA